MTAAEEIVQDVLSPEEFRQRALAIENEISQVIVGQRELIRQTVITLLAGGNALLEGVPGLAKTTLVRTLADVIDCSFSRIQFTPNLMPADIVGTTLISEDKSGRKTFRFEPGPIFANLILADEINRATPKTQSALLEAMQEHTVTVAKTIHRLESPFFVLATQNPLEMEGTYPLPEAQLDRFFFKIFLFPFQQSPNWWKLPTARPARGRRRCARWRMLRQSWRCSGWRGRSRLPLMSLLTQLA